MICDHIGCKIEPMRAPRVVVFSVTPFAVDHRPLKMMTTLHYCEQHKGELKLEDLLGKKVKREFEVIAKQKRPLDFKCDFEHAIIEWVLITTPEYRGFLAAMGKDVLLELALQR